jgi:hypothetical protein
MGAFFFLVLHCIHKSITTHVTIATTPAATRACTTTWFMLQSLMQILWLMVLVVVVVLLLLMMMMLMILELRLWVFSFRYDDHGGAQIQASWTKLRTTNVH